MKIFFDMDGVISDFGKRLEEIDAKNRDGSIAWGKTNNICFWADMPRIDKGIKLFRILSIFFPVRILSAHTRAREICIEGKRRWIEKKLGKKYARTAIFCWNAQKTEYAGKWHILIDDRETNIGAWRKAGGIGILFKLHNKS